MSAPFPRPTAAKGRMPFAGHRTVGEVETAQHEARRAADRRALDCAFGGA